MLKRGKKQKLEKKLRYLLLSTLLPVALLLVALLVLFWQYADRYNELSGNLAVSSEFNLHFKEELDLKMYYIAVGSSYQTELPMEYVEDAMEMVSRLKESTHQKEGQKCLKHLDSLLTNLQRRMNELTEIKLYDDRMAFMDNNIRIITGLVMKEMQNYIYSESMYLVQVEQELIQNVRLIIGSMCLLLAVTVGTLLVRALHFSSHITESVAGICRNVRAVGHGEFAVREVETDSLEIEELDAGIRKMAGRIQQLLENLKMEQEMQHLTELQLLQAQINPHFLYNTLDTIVWLIEGEQKEQALDMISSLSIFFRTSLSKGEDIIPLSEEKKHIISYLEIQHFRYRDILEFEIDIPDTLLGIRLPKLTLQPLVENALYHGIKNKRGKGMIRVKGRDMGEKLFLSVEDSGQGMSQERLEEVQESIRSGEKTGFGLAAVAERLKLYYGDGYGMGITSREGEGTRVEIALAKKIKPKS